MTTSTAATKVHATRHETYDDQLDRAIERAGKSGVKVLACGRIKSTGQRFWIVSSVSDADHPHLCFKLASGRISCDCKAGRSAGRDGVCHHVAAVVMHETVQADRRRRQAEEMEAAEREERAAIHARLSALNARMERHGAGAQPRQMEQAEWQREAAERDSAPLYRDTKPFSIFR